MRDIGNYYLFLQTTHPDHIDEFETDIKHACRDNYACLPCKPGEKFNHDKCEPCPEHSFQQNFQSSECVACPDGHSTNQTGSTRPEDCVCSPGFEEASE